MNRKYRELVAIRVVFSKVTEIYKLVHFYRVVTIEEKSGPLAMEGYEMERHNSAKDIAESLRDAYAPATLSIWMQDELASNSELLQFQPGARPDDLGLDGDWSLWAEL
jgi:hypothetical protein